MYWRAVAVGLLDLDGQPGTVGCGEQAVDPDPAPGGEVDDDDTGGLPGGQQMQRVRVGHSGADPQGVAVVGAQESGRAEQR